MTISKVKKELLDHVGDIVSIKYNLGRNKYEEYEAKIKELYDYIFLIEYNNNGSIYTKSFTYTDVLTKVIRIDY